MQKSSLDTYSDVCTSESALTEVALLDFQFTNETYIIDAYAKVEEEGGWLWIEDVVID